MRPIFAAAGRHTPTAWWLQAAEVPLLAKAKPAVLEVEPPAVTERLVMAQLLTAAAAPSLPEAQVVMGRRSASGITIQAMWERSGLAARLSGAVMRVTVVPAAPGGMAAVRVLPTGTKTALMQPAVEAGRLTPVPNSAAMSSIRKGIARAKGILRFLWVINDSKGANYVEKAI